MSTSEVDAAVALLADGPVPDVELLAALDTGGRGRFDEHRVLRFLQDVREDGRIVLLPDGRAALREPLLAGLVSWHRVTDAEVADRGVELGDAVVVIVAALDAMEPVAVGDVDVVLRDAVGADGEVDVSRGPIVDLPVTWRPDLVPGDLVAIGDRDGRLALLDATPPDGGAGASVAEDEIVAAVRDLAASDALAVVALDSEVGAVTDDAAYAAALIEAGSWVLALDEVVGPRLLTDHGGALRALDRPVAEVLGDAGWRVEDGTVVGPGVDDELWLAHSVGRDLIASAFGDHRLELGEAEMTGMAWAVLHSGDPSPDVLAELLAAPVVAEAVAARVELLGAEEAAELVAILEVAAGGGRSVGASLVLCRALPVVGRLADAVPIAEVAFAGAEEDWVVGAELLGLVRMLAGDVEGALAVYRRLEVPGVVERLERSRPTRPSGVGRNDPCPCGSGRKFKQCCQRTPPPPSLEVRVPFLWWKLQMTVVELYGSDLPRLADRGVSEQLGMVAIDALLVADEAILDVARLIGDLLPDDERELLDRWGLPRHSLYEVDGRDGDALVLSDLVDEGERRVALDAIDHAHDGATVVAVVVPGPDGLDHVVGPVVHIPPTVRTTVVEALRSDLDAQGLVDLVEDLVATAPDAHLH